MMLRCRILLLLCLLPLALPWRVLAAGPHQVPDAGTFPWRATTATELNLRSGPGTGYASKGVFDSGAFIIVDYRTTVGNWVKVSFNEKVQGAMEGYVEGSYLNYISQLYPPPPEKEPSPLAAIWAKVWRVLRIILIVVAVLLLYIFKEAIFEVLSPMFLYGSGGALIFWLLFKLGWLGATIGAVIGLIVGLSNYYSVGGIGNGIILVLKTIYDIVSLPFYLLNQLQIILSEPWRYIFKQHVKNDDTREFLRIFLEVLKVILYIALTPLRLLNAIYFNIVVHGLISLYDLLMEVLIPCNEKEGKGNFGKWLLMLPWRILRYPVFHGTIAILESVAWTVIDIFVPAVTLYHGTDLTAGQSIAGSRNRNNNLNWKSGTFTASESSWGGIGVYFAFLRRVAIRYATDPYRLNDLNPVVIVCRVSPGRIINYSLAPGSVYYSTGYMGKPQKLNSWSQDHRYTTGEWWNAYGGYWELCLFDWQNLYNSRWRIRTIYVYNIRTRLFQHIKGGKAHWSFKF